MHVRIAESQNFTIDKIIDNFEKKTNYASNELKEKLEKTFFFLSTVSESLQKAEIAECYDVEMCF